MKPAELEAEHWFLLCLHCSWWSENCIVEGANRNRRINQWQWSFLDFVISWFFQYCFQLKQPSFHWIITNDVINTNGKKMETFWFFLVQFHHPYHIAYNSNLRFSLGHKQSYHSIYNSDSVASKTQPSEIACKYINNYNQKLYYENSYIQSLILTLIFF